MTSICDPLAGLGDAPEQSCIAAWLDAIHRRAVDRVPDADLRQQLLGYELVPNDASGWPSFELRHCSALHLSLASLDSYRLAMSKVLAEAAGAVVQAEQPVRTNAMLSLWDSALKRLHLPSTRLLLSQHSRIKAFTSDGVVIEVDRSWLPMVEKRRDLVEKALVQSLGCPVDVTLVPVEDGEQHRQEVEE